MSRILPALFLSTLSLSLAACHKQDSKPPLDRPVKLMTVGGANVTANSDFAGEVRARIESNLGFRVPGKIISRSVEMGQRVHKGQELAKVDPRDFQLSDQAANSQLIAAKAQLETAKSDLQRFEALRQKGYVSATDIERKRTELSAAEAMYEQASSGLSLEKNRLADTALRADADGVVIAVLSDVGEVVAAGQPVIRVAQDGAREVEVEFPEDKKGLAQHAQAAISLWAKPGESWPAQLRELAAAADPVTRTFRARYTVKAPAGELLLGQSATLHLQMPIDSKGVTRLPTTAIYGQQNQTRVWVYDQKSSTVKSLTVKVAGVDGNDVLVAGLMPGQQIVTAGVHVLSENQKVTPFVSITH